MSNLLENWSSIRGSLLETFDQLTIEKRRLLAGKLVKKKLPFELQDESNCMSKLEELHQQGYATVMALPHFSESEFLRVIAAFLLASKTAREIPILAPIATHQAYDPRLKRIVKLTGIDLAHIVTNRTKQKELELQQVENPIPWPINKVGSGAPQYLKKARTVITEGGIVYVAPQAQRQDHLEPFSTPTLTTLFALARRRNSKVCLGTLGIEMEGCDDYSQSGLNEGVKYNITFGGVHTDEEIQSQIGQSPNGSMTIEDFAYEQMVAVAPQEYLPI